MLDGELEYRRGHYDAAFGHLRRAVELDDGLPYDEPWAWIQPARHAYGALLLEQDRVAEAETVYRADLGLDPDVAEGVPASGQRVELARLPRMPDPARASTSRPESSRQQLEIASAYADVPIRASCYCRLSAAGS